MTKSLLIAAALLSAGSAFASKARTGALANSEHLVDFQNGFEKPYQFVEMGELVTFEWGGSGNTTPHGEGGFLRKHDAGVYGFYLGRRSSDFSDAVTFANAATATPGLNMTSTVGGLLYQENTWNLLYGRTMGDMKIGFNFGYSKADQKAPTSAGTATATAKKSDSMGFSIGAAANAWDAALVMGLSGNSSADTAGGTYQFKSKSNMKITGGYHFDTMYAYLLYKNANSTFDVAGTSAADIKTTDMDFGVVDTVKKDGVNFFYGIAYETNTTKEDVGSTKTETAALPIIIGVEADAASWLVLRGSVKQDTGLVGGVKTAAGTNSTGDTTSVAAGMGVKFNKFTLDGTLTSNTGKLFDALGTNGIAANTSLTYNF